MANPIIREILRQGRRQPRKLVKAALETGQVESGFRNLPGGDADSAGWRQERASLYRDPTNVRASVRRFYREAAQHNAPGKPAWKVAADTQRPREDLRTRYRDARGVAEGILSGRRTGGGGAGGAVQLGRAASVDLERQSTFDQAGFEQAQRRTLVAQMLQRSGRGGTLFRTGLLSTAAPDRADFTSSKLVSKLDMGTDPRLVPNGDPDGELRGGAASKAVKAARNRLGISEVGTSNRGPQVDRMSHKYGMVGVPWCGIFVGTVLGRAGVRTDSRIASVAAIEAMGRNREGAFRGFNAGGRGARRGDLLITRKGQHVAFIERVDKDGTIHTIGGNESGRVQRASYKPGSVYGSVRVRYRR